MSKRRTSSSDGMQREYDFSKGVRGKYVGRVRTPGASSRKRRAHDRDTGSTGVGAARAKRVTVGARELRVELVDGRSVSVPLAWFPRLRDATRSERTTWRLIGKGLGIHWPAVDEDISIAGLLSGDRAPQKRAPKRKSKSRRSKRH